MCGCVSHLCVCTEAEKILGTLVFIPLGSQITKLLATWRFKTQISKAANYLIWIK